jgi:hypothetical protein
MRTPKEAPIARRMTPGQRCQFIHLGFAVASALALQTLFGNAQPAFMSLAAAWVVSLYLVPALPLPAWRLAALSLVTAAFAGAGYYWMLHIMRS